MNINVEISKSYGGFALSKDNRKLNIGVSDVKKAGTKDNVMFSRESKNASQSAIRAEKRQKTKEQKEKDDYSKALMIASRIRRGGKVPPEDEKFLMQFDLQMYLFAKMSASAAENAEKKYDSVLNGDKTDKENSGNDDTKSVNTDTDLSVDVNSFANSGNV
ncbi:MAG: hypothetical protein LBH98_10225 [Chitinispirillales bacterium]|jgi:hypothetical protein|nr:hypothetical protein [Chitinispirillales bacterium]